MEVFSDEMASLPTLIYREKLTDRPFSHFKGVILSTDVVLALLAEEAIAYM